jgi:hypothetical protein
MAGYESLRIAGLYGRQNDNVAFDQVERVVC